MELINEKLIRVRIHILPNELYFRFHTENDVLYTRYNPESLGIGGLTVPFRLKLADLDPALERITKSPYTAQAVEADRDFDSTFTGLSDYAASCRYHYSPEVRQAAENIATVFEHYGNIGRQAYRQELASSHNLLQELRARANSVAAMNLEPWMAAHEQAAQALAALLDERTGETAKLTGLHVRQVRREMDAIYRQITDRIDAMININGRDFVPGFVAEYNAHAVEYKNKLAQHLGRIRADKGNGGAGT